MSTLGVRPVRRAIARGAALSVPVLVPAGIRAAFPALARRYGRRRGYLAGFLGLTSHAVTDAMGLRAYRFWLGRAAEQASLIGGLACAPLSPIARVG
jgi:hypothetical protein